MRCSAGRRFSSHRGLRSLARDRPVHARLSAAGVSDAAREAQLALACAGVGVAVWAAMAALGAIWCAPALAGVDVALAQVPLLALGFVGGGVRISALELGRDRRPRTCCR